MLNPYSSAAEPEGLSQSLWMCPFTEGGDELRFHLTLFSLSLF